MGSLWPHVKHLTPMELSPHEERPGCLLQLGLCRAWGTYGSWAVGLEGSGRDLGVIGADKGLLHGRRRGPESIVCWLSLAGPFYVMQPALNNVSDTFDSVRHEWGSGCRRDVGCPASKFLCSREGKELSLLAVTPLISITSTQKWKSCILHFGPIERSAEHTWATTSDPKRAWGQPAGAVSSMMWGCWEDSREGQRPDAHLYNSSHFSTLLPPRKTASRPTQAVHLHVLKMLSEILLQDVTDIAHTVHLQYFTFK